MAGKNNFYPYGESSTNILNNSEYQTDQERTAGAARGAIARSKIYNKALRQSAAGAYAVADLVAAAGKDADDANAVTLAENFRAAVSYQARAFVAAAVSVSGGLATATVDELATTAKDDLPALFSLAMVLDQSLPAGASIKIASSLPDTDLTFPIYSGGEVLEDDVITAGAISLMIDTIGGKAFFRAGGMGKLPSDLAPLCPNFKVERNGGKIKVSADKIQLNPYTNMVQGGVWAWGKTRPVKPTGANLKQWTRADLLTTGKPYDGLYLGDVTPSDAVTETLLWLPENDSGSVKLVPFIVLSTDYLGGVYVLRKNVFGKSVWSSGSSGYENSTLDQYFSNTYLNSVIASPVKEEIMEVSIAIRASSASSTATKNISRKVFAPSFTELAFGVQGIVEGTQMPHFNSTTRRQAGPDSNPNSYVTYDSRTWIYQNQPATHWSVDANGASTGTANTASNATRPSFVLPKDFKIQQRPDGSYTVWNEQGLMTLGDVMPSDTSVESIVHMTESGELSPFILLSQKYGDKDVSVLHREHLLPESWNSNYSGTTDYAASGIQTKFEEYAASTLDAPYRALLVSVEVTYKNLNPTNNWERKLSTKCCAIGAEELGIVSGWGLGNIFSYYESSENKKKKHDEGSYDQWYTRDIQSAFYSSNNAWDDRKPYFVNASGTTSGAPSIGHNLGLCPMLFFDVTTPIRQLADGTYDLVPDDPALAQGVSTMAETGTTVQLKDIPVSTAGNAVILKIPETDGEQNYIYLRKGYDGADTAGTLMREDPDSQSLKFNTTVAKNAYPYYMSELDSYAQNFESKLDASVVSQLVEGQVFCGVISNSENKTMARKIFVASEKEMGISTGSTYPEGTAFDYFASNESRVAKYSYFTRSTNMSGGSNRDIMVVLSDGSYGLKSQTSSYYMRPIILVSLDAWFTDNGDDTYTFVGDEPAPTEQPLSIEIDWPESDPLIARQWVYNTKGQYQTMLLGGVASTEDAPAYSPVLSENTWEQIAEAIANNDPIVDSWQIGDTKDEVVAGETLTFTIVGKDHDDKSDGTGKAKLTFGMTQLMNNTRQMNSSNTSAGSFAGSALYAYLRDTILPGMPEELRAAIKPVNKQTSSGSGSSAIRNDSMSLWLFSEVEIFGATTYSFGGEGFQYSYFATAANRIKRLSNGMGEVSRWWERSPRSGYGDAFCCVATSGAASIYTASNSIGVCLGFCI